MGGVREDRVRQSERALSIYSPCAQRGGKLLFESTHGADDFVVRCIGSKDERTETYSEHVTRGVCAVWMVQCAGWATTGGRDTTGPIICRSC